MIKIGISCCKTLYIIILNASNVYNSIYMNDIFCQVNELFLIQNNKLIQNVIIYQWFKLQLYFRDIKNNDNYIGKIHFLSIKFCVEKYS